MKIDIIIKNDSNVQDLSPSELIELKRKDGEYVISSIIQEKIEKYRFKIQHSVKFSQDTFIYILVGISIGGILKTFLEAIIKEAGKDFWSFIKIRLSKLWNKQNEKTYRNHGKAYILFNIGNDYVAFTFMKQTAIKGEILNYSKDIESKISDIYSNLDQIEDTFSKIYKEHTEKSELSLIEKHKKFDAEDSVVFEILIFDDNVIINKHNFYLFIKKNNR